MLNVPKRFARGGVVEQGKTSDDETNGNTAPLGGTTLARTTSDNSGALPAARFKETCNTRMKKKRVFQCAVFPYPAETRSSLL